MKKFRRPGPGLVWHLRNRLRPSYWLGWLFTHMARLFSYVTGIVTITTELRLLQQLGDGTIIDYGTVGYRKVTDAGADYMAGDFNTGANDISLFNFHGVGTGSNAENTTDVALQANVTPGGQYIAGTKSAPGSKQYLTSASVTFAAAGNIQEHGLFSQANPSGAVLWDRTVFSPIGVSPQDAITFQYTLTINSGG
ncbi:MAG: hypothetical protein KDE53_27740 [Caldilineaceae bacterium]|nr:hypothetical protein [Caldilineaceae bacterium]